MSTSNGTNRLIDSKSPYLLQHAHNPVDWYPWGEEALQNAKNEDKPIIVSIGYSSCHWCHVMAHESFEDSAIAELMNKHFINIKIDREERPDIDQIYMDAVQAMGLRGGWPLNVFLTPDQKPFYGGTYFPKEGWQRLLIEVNRAFQENREKLNESADKLAQSLSDNLSEKYRLASDTTIIKPSDFESVFNKLMTSFDKTWGGMKKAPKFPMPSTWLMLGEYYDLSDNDEAYEHLLFTLDKISDGGIYDQVGGGFARYAVDDQWHVPHFEKMLYDNGQLMSLYADAYRLSKKPEYNRIIMETAEWLKREMMDNSGGFYAALDADSEGIEGKFYVWSKEEVDEIAGEHSDLIATYYDVSPSGNWEGHNVLRKLKTDEEIMSSSGISEIELEKIISDFKSQALEKRSERIRPGLDNKIISGWNGLMLTGLLNGFQATKEKSLLDLATKNAHYIKDQLIINGELLRIDGLPTEGFLEDYAAVIEAFITYYQTTFDEDFLFQARDLSDHVIADFYDKEEKLFFYTANDAEELITRKKELFDNVIPASNSIMAHNFFLLGILMDNDNYKSLAKDMVQHINHLIKQEPEYMSNWARLAIRMSSPTPEIIIVGKESQAMATSLNAMYIPNKIIQAMENGSNLPLAKDKSSLDGKTTIYVCFNKTCQLPVHSIEDALKQLN